VNLPCEARALAEDQGKAAADLLQAHLIGAPGGAEQQQRDQTSEPDSFVEVR